MFKNGILVLFCNSCSSNRIELPLEFGYKKDERVCLNCFDQLKKDSQLERKKIREEDMLSLQMSLFRSSTYEQDRLLVDIGHTNKTWLLLKQRRILTVVSKNSKKLNF